MRNTIPSHIAVSEILISRHSNLVWVIDTSIRDNIGGFSFRAVYEILRLYWKGAFVCVGAHRANPES